MQTINFDKLNINAGDTVLDIGCGEGRHSIGLYVDKEVNAIGIDLSMEDMKTARSRIKDFSITDTNISSCVFGVGDIKSLPFKDNVHDAVICSEVLEHLDSLDNAVSEIVRVLKPGGVLAVSVPRFIPELICWKLSSEYSKTPGGHVRIFKQKNLKQLILKEKFNWDDGEVQDREWTINKIDENNYEGTAGDVVGKAVGYSYGPAFKFEYVLLVPVKGKELKITFDDWIFKQDDRVAINRATMTKFGFKVAELTVVFVKD